MDWLVDKMTLKQQAVSLIWQQVGSIVVELSSHVGAFPHRCLWPVSDVRHVILVVNMLARN